MEGTYKKVSNYQITNTENKFKYWMNIIKHVQVQNSFQPKQLENKVPNKDND